MPADDEQTERSSISEQQIDELFAVLSEGRRRRVLRSLPDGDEEVSLTELAARVRERTAESSSDPASAADRLAVRLHHGDLPKLAGAGLVEYDSATRRVRATERVPAVCSYLEGIEALTADRWE